MTAGQRWRLYSRVWMVVQCAEGEDAAAHLGEIASSEFGHMVKPEDVRVVVIVDGEAQLQVRLPVLHREFDQFEQAHFYAVEHNLANAVIVRRDSHHDEELQHYGRRPLEPFVVSAS